MIKFSWNDKSGKEHEYRISCLKSDSVLLHKIGLFIAELSENPPTECVLTQVIQFKDVESYYAKV